MEFSKWWALRFSFFGKKGVRLGLVKGEGRVPGTCLVDFCLPQHIPNSTGVSSFKLDRQEKSATEVCVSSFDLVSLHLF